MLNARCNTAKRFTLFSEFVIRATVTARLTGNRQRTVSIVFDGIDTIDISRHIDT